MDLNIYMFHVIVFFFFFKQKTAYEMRISHWSSDVCSSDLHSIDAAAAALSKFEDYNKYRDFKSFHIQQAVGFKRKLADQVSGRTGERLSSSTQIGSASCRERVCQYV